MPQFAVHYRDTRRAFWDGVEHDPIVTVGVARVCARNERDAAKRLREMSTTPLTVVLETVAEPWPLPLGAPKGSVIPCRFPEPAPRACGGLGREL